MARTPGLTPEISLKITTALRNGVSVNAACRQAGVPKSTYYKWLTKGRDGMEAYEAFYQAVEKATGEAEEHFLKMIQAIAAGKIKGNWQAYAWILERRFHEDWRRRDFDAQRAAADESQRPVIQIVHADTRPEQVPGADAGAPSTKTA